MAIAGLTINLLENDWNEENLMMMLTSCDGISPEAFQRIIVGLLLVMITHDKSIRRDRNLLCEIQEILTYDPELSFTALHNIARTTQMNRMEQFNAKLTKELLPLLNNRESNEFYDIIRNHQSEMEYIAKLNLDQNFMLFREFYSTPFFREEAANWLKPWKKEALLNLDESDREELTELLKLWTMCDSDKYALCGMYHVFRSTIKSQLSIDSLQEVGIEMRHSEIVTNGYVQQLYRFFRLSRHTHANPFKQVANLRELLVYRLIVVGKKAQESLGQLLA
jgi:hypothetical protein